MSAYPKVKDAGTANRGRFLRLLSAVVLGHDICRCKGVARHILMPNRPVRTRAANSRVKPTVNCCSLEMVGVKGWLAEASQRLWRGVEDIDVLEEYGRRVCEVVGCRCRVSPTSSLESQDVAAIEQL